MVCFSGPGKLRIVLSAKLYVECIKNHVCGPLGTRDMTNSVFGFVNCFLRGFVFCRILPLPRAPHIPGRLPLDQEHILGSCSSQTRCISLGGCSPPDPSEPWGLRPPNSLHLGGSSLQPPVHLLLLFPLSHRGFTSALSPPLSWPSHILSLSPAATLSPSPALPVALLLGHHLGTF